MMETQNTRMFKLEFSNKKLSDTNILRGKKKIKLVSAFFDTGCEVKDKIVLVIRDVADKIIARIDFHTLSNYPSSKDHVIIDKFIETDGVNLNAYIELKESSNIEFK